MITKFGDLRFKHEEADKSIIDECVKLPDSGEYIFDDELISMLPNINGWIDVGAHIGAFIVTMASKYNLSGVAVEALADNCDLLEENLELNGLEDIEIFEMAVVGDDSDSVEFHIHPKYSSAGSIEKKIRGSKTITVDAININALLAEFPDYNALKIDVEGAESDIINVIDFSGIDVLILEYHMFIIKDLEDFYNVYHKIKQEFDVVTVRTVLRIYNKMLAYVTAYRRN